MSIVKHLIKSAPVSDRAESMRMLKSLSEGNLLEKSRTFYTKFLDRGIALLRAEPSILEVNSPNAVIVGDLHGDTSTLAKITKRWPPDRYTYLLTGDYVDRSSTGVELLATVLAHKIVHKDRFIILRGDHESPIGQLNRWNFDFELFEKLGSHGLVEKVYDQLFTELPMAAVLNRKYFIVHGGIPTGCPSLEELKAIGKSPDPTAIPEVEQMMWADPSTADGSSESVRGPGIRVFGPDIAKKFLDKNGLELIIRSHEHALGGFSITGKTITILSTTAYPKDEPYVGVVQGGNIEVYNLSAKTPKPMDFSALLRKNGGPYIRFPESSV